MSQQNTHRRNDSDDENSMMIKQLVTQLDDPRRSRARSVKSTERKSTIVKE